MAEQVTLDKRTKIFREKTELSNEQIATVTEDDRYRHYKDDHNEIFYADELVVVSELVEKDRQKSLEYLTSDMTTRRIEGWMEKTGLGADEFTKIFTNTARDLPLVIPILTSEKGIALLNETGNPKEQVESLYSQIILGESVPERLQRWVREDNASQSIIDAIDEMAETISSKHSDVKPKSPEGRITPERALMLMKLGSETGFDNSGTFN